jgi:uncharacterized protein (DUF1800 family)
MGAMLGLLLLMGIVTPSARTIERSDVRLIAHVLDRVTFGTRSQDLERVARVGIQTYIDEQLHPQRLNDDALEAMLGRFETLKLSTEEIAERYAIPVRQMRQQFERARRRQRSDEQSSAPPTPGPPQRSPEDIQRQRLVLSELTEQKLLRAIYSERQLQEVLVDFWFNHFNVFAGKGVERYLLTSYERDVIRPHVFSSFRELLGATAHSPAMLFYLDNWLSVDPGRRSDGSDGSGEPPRSLGLDGDPAEIARGRRQFGFNRPRRRPSAGPQDPAKRPQNPRRTGLNENYARELLELHTLGVDGGYTQQDVVQVARVFTGWTIHQPRRGATFRFDARLHDNADKVVLGHQIRGSGEEEGEYVLDILAKHPSTARFISTKLARRFVSDNPPASLVDRLARRFQETNGSLREVVRTILTSPEFLAPEAYRTKVKSPLEFVVSAVRATGAEVSSAASLGRTLRELGMPLYMSQPPTGYADDTGTWVNTGALIGRMNFAMALADNQLSGVSLDTRSLEGRGDTAAMRGWLTNGWLRGDTSAATLETMAKATEPAQLVALAIGSPEFQRK